MKAPLFSVVIPTFNRSELFPFAVRSILNQTFTDFEIIVSDNCSADPTPEVAKQFTDPRVTYVRTPRHFTIADAWEFARSHAKGKFILMLSDDDALVGSALERFARESTDHDADFLFSRVAEYRDESFPGADRNSVDCPSFSGTSRIILADEFIRPLFSFRLKFNMHPSAFVFPKTVAEYVKERTGRFFWTNGVEYSAWPITAIFAKRILFIDEPLTLLGRTGKSWGSNIALCNPGKERIQEFINDVDHVRKHAPLNNFTMCNLMAEGMLTAKSLFPKEFAAYEFDELKYLSHSMAELRRRQALGVEVSEQIEDVIRHAEKYPLLKESFQNPPAPVGKGSLMARARATIGDVGNRVIRGRVARRQLVQKLNRGGACLGFRAFGKDFGFANILECAEFLTRNLVTAHQEVQRKTVSEQVVQP